MTDKSGFTLIELMIVVAVLSVLGMIAIPKFGEMMIRARESTTKANLGKIRGALSLYYSSTEGVFPDDLASLSSGGFVDDIPALDTPAIPSRGISGHLANRNVSPYASIAVFGTVNEGASLWAYVNAGEQKGHVGINCTHEDTKGSVWSNY